LSQTVKWRLILRNPENFVDPPRPECHEVRTLSEDETAVLLSAAKSTRLYIPVLFAVATGLRRGEVLGLRWSDVDLENGVLSVRRSLTATKSGLVFKQSKTAQSSRQVSLLPLILDVLGDHRTEQQRNRLALGPAYTDHGLVSARSNGKPVNPRQLSKDFLGLVRRIKIPRIRFHDLRHTHATQLLRQEVHPKIVSERLGHSSVAITPDFYSHMMPGMQEDAAPRLDVSLGAAIRAQTANIK